MAGIDVDLTLALVRSEGQPALGMGFRGRHPYQRLVQQPGDLFFDAFDVDSLERVAARKGAFLERVGKSKRRLAQPRGIVEEIVYDQNRILHRAALTLAAEADQGAG